MVAALKAPFPYFGGKSRIAPQVWARLGDCPNYVEPFFGSGAMLFARPDEHEWWDRIETVNDADGYCANFWRALRHDPQSVAVSADGPTNENDLHAVHHWLRERAAELELPRRLEGDIDWYDAQIAGRWAKGMCEWIGSGWCGPSGEGPWAVDDEGRFVKSEGGVKRQLPNLGNAGNGVCRQRPHLGGAGQGVCRQLPHLGDAGKGVCRQRPHLGDAGQGVPDIITGYREHLTEYFASLANRLRRVRVCCGDWSRICGPTPTVTLGTTAVFLDPPYSKDVRDSGCYSTDTDCAAEVRKWCLSNGNDPRLRIALCGYNNEGHAEPLADAGWTALAWKAHGGYGNQSTTTDGRENATREVVWFSPHCIEADKPTASLRFA